MPTFDLLSSFNAGELSPLLASRTNLEKYKSGCRVLENFIPMPYGGVNRRPGTEFVMECYSSAATWTATLRSLNTDPEAYFYTTSPIIVGDSVIISGVTYKIHRADGPYKYIANATTGVAIPGSQSTTVMPAAPFNFTTIAGSKTRLFSFNYSPTTRYILEFGNHTLRILRGDATPAVAWSLAGSDGSGNVVPYADHVLADLQLMQINDVVYIVHPEYPLHKLSRLSDTSWTIKPVEFEYPPTLDENSDDTIKLTPSGTTGNITLTASAGGRVSASQFFSWDDVGSYWLITHRRSSMLASLALTATANSVEIQVLGDWELTTSGTWSGNLFIQRREINKTEWETIRHIGAVSDRNYSFTGNQPYPAFLRLSYTAISAGSGSPRAQLTLTNSRQTGIVKITGLNTFLQANATVITPLFANTATWLWAEQAFSDYWGHPSAIVLHEQRLYLAGNNSRRMTVWGSQVDDFENFRVGTTDSDGLMLTLASGQQNTIEWMVSQDSLIIGTNGDEWALGSGSTDKAISPTNIRATNQSRYGSANLRGILLADVVLFVQRNGRKVRELTYSFESDSWVAADLTLLAEHVTRGGIMEMAYQQQPEAILWAVRSDGVLAGMTYERDQNVVGWHRHTTDGNFESVSVIHGNGTEDEVWLVVRRTIAGVTKRYIERFSLNWRYYLEEGLDDFWCYVDSAKRFTNGSASTSVTGLSHLNGKTVTVYTVEGNVETKTVASGAITLSTASLGGVVGLPFTSTLQPMRLNIDFPNGTSQGRKARVHGAIVRLFQSRGGEVQTNGGSWYALGSGSSVFTGDRKITLAGNFDDMGDITIRQTQPWPLTVISLIPKWDAYGNE